ncbi:MAG TPA: SMC family ATPase [Gemmatimonadaceae bacterium]|nr:SMC family ATPase [Gemmatimonadaceae bacterium]
MRLNTLRLQNFRQHADTKIAFAPGLTGIIGPNGAGKSTLLEAIAWAIYGNPAARGTRDSIRFNRAGPRDPVRVELDFDLGKHRYRVCRGLTTAELFLDGSPTPIATSLTGVTELLQRRLGMSRTEFFNTYFTGQKELDVMAAMGPSERARFLSRVLGYERLRVAQDLVKDRRREIIAESSGLRSAMPDADSIIRGVRDAELRAQASAARYRETLAQLATSRRAAAEFEPRWQDAQRSRELLQDTLAELRVAEADEASHARDQERIERDLAAIAEARTELEQIALEIAPLAELADEFQRFEMLAREEGRRQTLTDTEGVLGEDLVRFRERLERIEREIGAEEKLTEQLDQERRQEREVDGQLEARRTEWVRDRQEAETKRDAFRAQYLDLKSQRDRLVELGEEGACPICTRPLGASFRDVLDQLEEQMETIKVDGRYYSDRLDQLGEMPADIRTLDEKRNAQRLVVQGLERQLARVQSAVAERQQLVREIHLKEQQHASVLAELASVPTGYDPARHETLQRETSRFAPLNERATRLAAQIDREQGLIEERERVVQARQALRARLGALAERRDAVRFSEREFAEMREEHERIAATFRAAEIAHAGAAVEVEAVQAAAERALQAKADLDRAQQQLDSLQRDRRVHDELDRAFSDLRTDLNFELRPELSEIASKWLTQLTDDRYTELRLDDEYNVRVLEERDVKQVLSGGEEDLANLVLRLAISQMIADRAGLNFSLLVLDEVFGSLDEARRQHVVELLRRLNDRFEQVIVITHIESVRDGLDRVIGVEYDEDTGASRVRTETDDIDLTSLSAGSRPVAAMVGE